MDDHKAYLDLPLRIDPLLSHMKTCDIQRAIHLQVYAVLSTQIQERPMCPEFGSRLKEYVFEGIQEETMTILEREVIASLHRWITCIRDISVHFVTKEDVLLVYVAYEIPSLQCGDEVMVTLQMGSL